MRKVQLGERYFGYGGAIVEVIYLPGTWGNKEKSGFPSITHETYPLTLCIKSGNSSHIIGNINATTVNDSEFSSWILLKNQNKPEIK